MLSNKKGVAMVLVIGLVLMLLILGAAVLMVSMGHFGTSFHQIKRARAFYTAEAGMQHALWMCRTGNLPSGCDLVDGCGGSWPITDSISINDLTATIKIWPEGELAMEGIHPIHCEVTY